MQSYLIDLYTNNLCINGYTVNDIINLDDRDLNKVVKYISWFFPAVCTVTQNDRDILSKNINIRSIINKLVYRVRNVVDVTLKNRIIDFLDYIRLKTHINMKKIIFKGLYNVRNSCYMDSVLVSLFASPNKIMESSIIQKNFKSQSSWITCSDKNSRKKIQIELVRIINSFRGYENVRDCKDLRKSLESCNGSQQFHKGGMQDAGEFLLYLFNIFEVNVTKKHRATYVTNSIANPPKDYVKTFTEVQDCTPLINIPSLRLEKGLDVTKFLNDTEDAIFSKEDFYRHTETGIRYRRRIENTRVVETSYIVFNVERIIYTTDRFINTKINIPDYLVVGKNNVVLNLNAVVVYVSSHYTCYFKNSDVWYYYDDLDNSTVEIGDYTDLLESSPSVQRNCTLLFYT